MHFQNVTFRIFFNKYKASSLKSDDYNQKNIKSLFKENCGKFEGNYFFNVT